MEQTAIVKKELERELANQAAQEVAHAARQQEAEACWFKCKKQFQVETEVIASTKETANRHFAVTVCALMICFNY